MLSIPLYCFNNDERILNALNYILDQKHGYLNDLTEKVGEHIKEQFISLGFIKLGNCRNGETWKLTKFAKKYYNVVK